MKLATIAMTAILTVGSFGIANANVIQNGDFSATSLSNAVPTHFGTDSGAHGQFIDHWYGNDGYAIWYPDGAAAVNINAQGKWQSTGQEKLYGPITHPGPFVGLDGDQTPGTQASISQDLTGLTVGATYRVNFDWAAAQLQSRTGDTYSSLIVSLFGDSESTGDQFNPSESFSGWWSETMEFVADSSTATLQFLAKGTPGGLPPVSLLSNVSMSRVPAPASTLALLGGGVLLLGLGFATRRRGDNSGNAPAA